MGERAGWVARTRGLAGGLGALALGALGRGLRARMAAPAQPLRAPEPRLGGDPDAGRRLLAGRARLGAGVVDAPGLPIWDWPGAARPPDAEAAAALHRFAWLDDLAALGTPEARRRAQVWVDDWLARYGRGAGPGWATEAAAARLLAWTLHARLLLARRDARAQARLSAALRAHARLVERRWRRCQPGEGRLLPLAALVRAGLALPGREPLARRAATALGEEAARAVDAGGAVASRSPEGLLDVLALLTETAAAMAEAGLVPAPGHASAIQRIKPTLRALRHADGGLARFHGGDRGADGRLDGALAASGRGAAGFRGGQGGVSLPMGFARLAAGRTTVIVDAAPPPRGPASGDAHASTLAFEMTVGRRPLIVGCGPGRSLGPEWRRAGRATASHSTLAIEGFSSSRLGPGEPGGERIVDGPGRVIAEATPLTGGLRFEMAHDGWRPTHGLTHARILQLSPDGRILMGEDVLTTLTAADRQRLDAGLDAGALLGIAYDVRFHLHPDVDAEGASDGSVTLALRSGETWALRHEGDATLAVEPSVHLEAGRPAAARPALQVVLSGRALSYATRLRWTLASEGRAAGLRDLEPGAAPRGMGHEDDG